MTDRSSAAPGGRGVERPGRDHAMLTAAAMTALGALPVYLVSAQAVLMRDDLDLGAPQLGLAVGLFFGSAAVASAVSGPSADRLGRRTSTLVAGGMSAAGAAGMAFLVVSLPLLLVVMAVCGMANAALQTTGNLLLAHAVPQGRQGLAFGIKQSAVPAAALLGGLSVPAVGVLVGWRWTYLAVAVAAALVIYGGLRLPRRPTAGRQSRDGQGAPADALVVTAVAATLSSAGVTSLAAFFPAWAFESGLSPGLSGLLLAAGSALSVVGRIVSGIAADRRGRRHLPVVAAQLAAGAVALLLISVGSIPSLLVGALIAFGIGWSWPGLLLLSIVRVGRSNPGGASSAVQVGAFAGGCAGPVVFGLLVDSASYPVAWRSAAGALLVAAGLLLLARRMFLKDLRQRPM